VPLDTTQNSHYLNELYVSNSMQEYTFKYAEQHKAELSALGYEKYYLQFNVSEVMLEQLIQTGVQNKVPANRHDMERHKRDFQINIKAQVARKIWGNDGFYPVFNQNNEVLQQALKLFDRIPDLNRTKM